MDTETTTTAGQVIHAMNLAERSMKWTAERSGIAVGTFRRKIHGGGDFTVSEVARIAKALNMHPADLLPTAFARAA